MAFDFGQGLSEMGKAVATTGGELVKADLEQQKITLADQLAGAREEKQRGFLTSERVATQAFTSGENVENRKNAEKIATIGADAAVKSAGIHAGGAVAAANISATSHLAGIEKQLAANKPLIDVEVLSKSIANNSAQMVQDARKELQDARAANDPEKIKAAQQKEYDASYSSQAQVQQVSLFQAQAKLAETTLNSALVNLRSLQASPNAMMPDVKAQIDYFQKLADKAQREFDTAKNMSADALKDLPSYKPPGASSDTKFDLTKYLPRVGSAVGVKPKGMINNTPSIETPGTLVSPGP